MENSIIMATGEAVTAALAEAEALEPIVTTAADTASQFANISFTPANFVSNLGYMATGMIGIFVVIGVIILVTTAMNKLSSKKK